MSRTLLAPKRVGETKTYAFDLTPLLLPGQTVGSAVVTCLLYSGTDGSPGSIISGAASLSSDAKSVKQVLTAGVAGNTYTIQVRATLIAPADIVEVVGILAVLPTQS